MNKLTDYGVPEGNVLGIRYGFRGFYDKTHKPMPLTKKTVDGIQLTGGTILGTSRGGANIKCARPACARANDPTDRPTALVFFVFALRAAVVGRRRARLFPHNTHARARARAHTHPNKRAQGDCQAPRHVGR